MNAYQVPTASAFGAAPTSTWVPLWTLLLLSSHRRLASKIGTLGCRYILRPWLWLAGLRRNWI